MKFKFFQQLDRMDCGPCCLQMILHHHTNEKYKITFLRELCDIGKDGCSLYSIKAAAESFGLRSHGLEVKIEDLENLHPFPSILYWDENHFVILYAIKKDFIYSKRFYIADPYKGKYILNEDEFENFWCRNNGKGVLLYLEKSDNIKSHLKYIEIPQRNFLYDSIKKFQFSYFTILLGLLLSLVIQVIFPFLAKALFDFGIDEKNISFVLFIIISQAFFFLIRSIIQYLRDYSALKTGTKISIDFVTKYLKGIIFLKYEYFDTKNSGDIIQSITDNTRIESFLTNDFVSVILSTTNLIVFEFILFYFDWKLFLCLNVAISIYLIWSIFILKKFKHLDYLRFEIQSKNQSFIYQLINGILDLKMNNGILRKTNEWIGLREGLYDISKRSIFLHQVKKIIGLFILNFTNLAIIGYSAIEVINNNMSVGEFIAIQYIIAQLSLPIDNIIEFKLSYNLAKMSVDRFNEIQDYSKEEIASDAKRVNISTDICIDNVDFSYPGNKIKKVLTNVNAVIKKGKINAIVGPSGSGKTTFVKLILKLYEPSSGEIKVNNKNIDTIPHESWRKITGSVLQEGYLFSESLLNNIMIEGGEVNKKKLSKAIEIANLKDLIADLPKGYNSLIGLDGLGLSGGQKQRILIARCIYKDPEMLIFDEATNSLDSINENIIYNKLERYYKDKTVIVIAHRLSTIRNADQILVFNNGTIKESGNHEQLIDKKGMYFELCKKQLSL